jgi:hypothetical protein
MATNDYPRAWRAAAAILGGEAEPYIAELCRAFRSWAPPPPPPEPPLPFEPLLTYVKLRPIRFRWNAWIGRLVDADE